ncbi:MAG TPA: hypothetical protein VMW36_02930 [Patescibacteria group bacterium]|nr:hypothetical protein [Patescibacteria group bacterium]
MTNFHRKLLYWICRKLVVQSHQHHIFVTEYYSILAECYRKQFAEDNEATVRADLRECHTHSLNNTQTNFSSDDVLADAIDKHNLTALEGYDKDTLISLINYAKYVGQSEGYRDAKEELGK